MRAGPVITVRKTNDPEDLRRIHRIRNLVFVDEQGCPPELEIANEEESIHFLAFSDQDPCGAARWRKTNKGFKLERFAVLREFRGKGIGAALLDAVLNDLPSGDDPVYLNAQLGAVSFYERFQFIQQGDIFVEAGIQHKQMAVPVVAFVTFEEKPDFAPDDFYFVSYLRKKNVRVYPVVWSDPVVDWTKFDLIVFRSIWDYYLKPEEFNQWLKQMKPAKLPFLNSLSVLEWNRDKKYLLSLRDAGIPIPDFEYCKHNIPCDLTSILDRMKKGTAVVKPSVSGGAYNTYLASAPVSVAEDEKFQSLLRNGSVIVQEFREEIKTNGEISLIFFDRVFSHAVQKVAMPGDFRVQPKFGGKPLFVQASADLINLASAILEQVPEELLYARVDLLLLEDGSYSLMELELIEPILFAEFEPKAPENFFRALMKFLHKQRRQNQRSE